MTGSARAQVGLTGTHSFNMDVEVGKAAVRYDHDVSHAEGLGVGATL